MSEFRSTEKADSDTLADIEEIGYVAHQASELVEADRGMHEAAPGLYLHLDKGIAALPHVLRLRGRVKT